MKPKKLSLGILLGAALACSAAFAQSPAQRAAPNEIVVSGTNTVPYAIVTVVPNNSPRTATAPIADATGPVSPSTSPPGANVEARVTP